MKPLLIIPALILLGLAGCGQKGDALVREKLAGTWIGTGGYGNGGSFKSTVTVNPKGNYVCQVVSQGISGDTRTASIEGTWEVRAGVLIDTVTKHSNTNAVLPMTNRADIVRIDDQEMVLKWESPDGVMRATNNVLVFQKARK